MHVLEALATLVPMATMAAETLVELEGHELAYGTTVVMVTAVATPDLVHQLRDLRRGGHRPAMLLITSAEQPLAPWTACPPTRSDRGHAMNRLSLTLGLAAMDACWIYPWSVLLGLWIDPARPRRCCRR